MSHHHSPVTRTADTEAAAFLLVSNLRLLRIEIDHAGGRGMYIFADRQHQGAALRAAFAAGALVPANAVLSARRRLVRGVMLARSSPTGYITGNELCAYFLAGDAARRAASIPQRGG